MEKRIFFRKAVSEDAELLYQWRNEEASRENAFDPSEIPWKKHLEWFKSKVNNPATYIFILNDAGGSPVGQVRFDIETAGTAVSHVIIDHKFRQKGYAVEGLMETCSFLLRESAVKQILAYIKKCNDISYRTFKKAGFTEIGQTIIKSNDSYIMRFEKVKAQD
ncbi:MAG: GNAT family N-acetyltransferase [Candidatus Omnitrophica bacterium]|nr:GNAT family N-acetyltransferase [Candidatus Omnitrophota bacterium]